MGRKISLVTTDMMRWDSLGFTGDPYAQSPNLDILAAEGMRTYGSVRGWVRRRCAVDHGGRRGGRQSVVARRCGGRSGDDAGLHPGFNAYKHGIESHYENSDC